jgi:hypothetical protein
MEPIVAGVAKPTHDDAPGQVPAAGMSWQFFKHTFDVPLFTHVKPAMQLESSVHALFCPPAPVALQLVNSRMSVAFSYTWQPHVAGQPTFVSGLQFGEQTFTPGTVIGGVP